MSTHQEMLELIDQDLKILVLVTGTLTNGSDHYAYVSIPPSRYAAFKQAEAAGNYDLTAFGEILAHGEGKNPPADVRAEMETKHGVNHRFEEELQEGLRSLQKLQSS